MTKLDQILAATRERVALAKRQANPRLLERMAAAHQPRGFRRRLAAMSQAGPAIIAELKKASPSKGVIREAFSPSLLAGQLARGGASALSVLTDEKFFQGSLENLVQASSSADLPCLRKDFIVDEFQVLEAKAHHADAILLILAALADTDFRRLLARARELGLDVLCEVHDEVELMRALDGGAEIVGVNSRDLRTLEVDLETIWDLGPKIPSMALRVAESGIAKGAEVRELYDSGYHAFLIGEAFMRAEDPGQKLRQLLMEAGFSPQQTAMSADWRGTIH